MTENPLVSIIVITYNSAKFVLETLESAKAQTYQNIELIISDDASTDNTVEICRQWVEENKERFIRTEIITVPENTGIPANCNRGVKAAKGEWVKLIAGDDALLENCVEKYIIKAKENPEIEVMHSNVIHYRGFLIEEFRLPAFNSRSLKINQPDISAKEQFEILLRCNKVWAASLFLKKTIYEKVGPYDESVKYWEDRPMLLKITRNN
ncbi:glycosyltransferase family 2 protein, partial [Schleiferia thermophila]